MKKFLCFCFMFFNIFLSSDNDKIGKFRLRSRSPEKNKEQKKEDGIKNRKQDSVFFIGDERIFLKEELYRFILKIPKKKEDFVDCKIFSFVSY